MPAHPLSAAITLCGIGLCTIGGALLLQDSNPAHAAPIAMPAPQAGLTVVWYGTFGGFYGSGAGGVLLRAWSDGTVEVKRVQTMYVGTCGDASNASPPCTSPWNIISSPTQGYRAAADINADELVNGADLASVLGNWGDAPRVPFPPSDCPLNLINP